MKKNKLNKKTILHIYTIIALIIVCAMMIGVPVLCEADDEKGDEHVGSASVRIMDISSIRM